MSEDKMQCWTQALQDNDPQVSGDAIQAIANWARSGMDPVPVANALEHLINETQSPLPIQKRGVEALGVLLHNLSNPTLVLPTVQKVLQNKDWQIRENMIRELEPLLYSLENPTLLLSILLPLMEDNDRRVIKLVVWSLGELVDRLEDRSSLVDPLINALEDENLSLQEIVAPILVKLGDMRARIPLITWCANLGGRGQLNKCLEAIKLVNQLSPNDGAIHYMWGRALRELGQNEEAVEKLERAYQLLSEEKIEKFMIDTLKLLIPTYFQMHRPDKSLNWAQKLDKLQPNDFATITSMALSFNALERWEEACEKFQQAHALMPNNPDVLLHWGHALAKLDNIDEAIERFQQANQIRPHHADTLYEWGAAIINAFYAPGIAGPGDQIDLDQMKEALKTLKQANQLRPNHVETLVQMAKALGVLEQPKEALELLQQASQLDPENVPALNYQGTVFVQFGQFKHAAEVYEKVCHLQPTNATVWGFWGMVLGLMGYYIEAEEKLKHAYSLQPDIAAEMLVLGHYLVTKAAQWERTNQPLEIPFLLVEENNYKQLKTNLAITLACLGNVIGVKFLLEMLENENQRLQQAAAEILKTILDQKNHIIRSDDE